jgi:hypothetical protein
MADPEEVARAALFLPTEDWDTRVSTCRRVTW